MDDDDNGDNFTLTEAEIFAGKIFPLPDFSLIGFFKRANDECITKLHSMRITKKPR